MQDPVVPSPPPSRSASLLACLALAAAATAGAAHAGPDGPRVDAAAATPRAAAACDGSEHASGSGELRVRCDPSPSPVRALAFQSWTITVTDGGGRPVERARIQVTGGMPEHTHGLPTIPAVVDLGGGRYRIDGLRFHMPGKWVVVLRVEAGSLSDSVRYEMDLS